MSEEFTVNDRSSLHNFRTEIPNIVFDLGLDPYALSLYLYYKKVAGDNGACFQKKKTIMEKTGMSLSVIKERNRLLSQPVKELGGKSLIKITQRKAPDGNNLPTVIEIVDIWPDNFKILSTRFSDDGGVGREKTEVGREKAGEEDPIKESVVVVENKNSDSKQQTDFDKRITKDDLYRWGTHKNLNWTAYEIEEAWSVMKDKVNEISSAYDYAFGIIQKIRVREKNREIKQEQGEKKPCQKKSTRKKHAFEMKPEKPQKPQEDKPRKTMAETAREHGITLY